MIDFLKRKNDVEVYPDGAKEVELCPFCETPCGQDHCPYTETVVSTPEEKK